MTLFKFNYVGFVKHRQRCFPLKTWLELRDTDKLLRQYILRNLGVLNYIFPLRELFKRAVIL